MLEFSAQRQTKSVSTFMQLMGGKSADQCKAFVEKNRHLFHGGVLAVAQMYRDPRDGARFLTVLEKQCDAADELNRAEDRVEERQRQINDRDRELVLERDLFNLMVSFGRALLKTAVEDGGWNERDHLEAADDHLHVHVHDPSKDGDPAKDKVLPQALDLFGDLFEIEDLTMERLHARRLDVLGQEAIDGHAKREQERELAEMQASMRKEDEDWELEEVDKLGRSLEAAKVAAAEDDLTELDSSEDGLQPDREKTPEEKDAQVLKALRLSSYVEEATRDSRPRTFSDSTLDDDDNSAKGQKASTRRTMGTLISPEVQPKNKRAKTMELTAETDVKKGAAALKNDEDYE